MNLNLSKIYLFSENMDEVKGTYIILNIFQI